jgi:leader peptidase (prepilin peptidase)/N-methyltransferase
MLLTMLALFGLVVGSFLNVVIVRVPSDESILHPPSRCPRCQHAIAPYDNIPVVSWLLLRGRCRNCREPIPAGYPLVEATNAVLWVVLGLRFGATWPLLPYLLVASVLLVLSVIDFELYLLPNKITYPFLAVSALAVVPLSFTQADPLAKMLGAWLTGLGYFALLFIPAEILRLLLRKDTMGGGDFKLAPTLGIWVGWLHPILVVYALMIAAVTGLLAGMVLWAIRRERAAFPFGPWMAIGAFAVILAAHQILSPYGLTSP